MSSVTQRIREITQPRGGYINPSDFDARKLEDGRKLNEEENVHASITGMVVDYMTRFMMGTQVNEAFLISIKGAMCAEKMGKKGALQEIRKYINEIKGLDDKSLANACKTVTFDVWLRNPIDALKSKTAKETNPNKETIENIRIMIERSIKFWKEYGPIKKDGFTFENGGYTNLVDSGDGDYITEDTLWDFKVSKSKPKSDHTLQLLMYYLMGLHSKNLDFSKINKLGIFNPRLNTVYIKLIDDIPNEIIDEVSTKVIGYKSTKIEPIHTPTAGKLNMTEIMRTLGCSRYKVMKLYTERNLPLTKENNKYYIREIDLIFWLEEQKRIRNRQMIVSTIIAIVFFVIMLLLYLAILP